MKKNANTAETLVVRDYDNTTVHLSTKTKFFKYGKALASILKEKELTQKDFAKISGFSVSYVSEILSGKKMPDIETLEVICGKFNISMDVFFFKAINEEEIHDPERKKMMRELKPLINALSNAIYEQKKMKIRYKGMCFSLKLLLRKNFTIPKEKMMRELKPLINAPSNAIYEQKKMKINLNGAQDRRRRYR